jgi:hypothetical protein
LSFKGEETGFLGASASISDMKVALEGLSTMRNYPGGSLKVDFDTTVGAPLLFGARREITATFNSGFDVRDKIQIVGKSLVDGLGASINFITENSRSVNGRTVQGRSGFTSGTYDVHVYAMVYRDVHSSNGRLTTELA